MSTPLTITCQVHLRQGRGSRKDVQAGPAPERPVLPVGRVPRVARLMALAIRLDKLVQSGAITSYSELARLGHVTRPRVSQILSLVYLSPDIQEAILFLPRTERGRDPVILRDLLPIAATLGWGQQRERWAMLADRHHLVKAATT
jgi:hypothetical protein